MTMHKPLLLLVSWVAVATNAASPPSSWTNTPWNFASSPHPPSNWFDCRWSSETVAPWGGEQKEWCCTNSGVRCPPTDKFECRDDDVPAFSAAQREWCCAVKQVGCPFECRSRQRENWTEAQRKYCCLTADIGCAVDCTVERWQLSADEVTSCCNRSGLHCEGQVVAADAAAAVSQDGSSFRLTFRGDWEGVARNPKRKVQLFRMSLIATSEKLQSEPWRLAVTYVGSKMAGGRIPPTDKLTQWGFNVPVGWNVDDAAAVSAVRDAAAVTKPTARREVVVLGESLKEVKQLSESDDLLYFNYHIVGSNEDVTTINSDIEEGRETVLQDNNEGYSLILPDAEVELTATTMSSSSSPSSKGWLWAVAGSVLGLCSVGALVALFLNKKKTKQTNENNEMSKLFTLETVEVKDSSSDYDLVSTRI